MVMVPPMGNSDPVINLIVIGFDDVVNERLSDSSMVKL